MYKNHTDDKDFFTVENIIFPLGEGLAKIQRTKFMCKVFTTALTIIIKLNFNNSRRLNIYVLFLHSAIDLSSKMYILNLILNLGQSYNVQKAKCHL